MPATAKLTRWRVAVRLSLDQVRFDKQSAYRAKHGVKGMPPMVYLCPESSPWPTGRGAAVRTGKALESCAGELPCWQAGIVMECSLPSLDARPFC